VAKVPFFDGITVAVVEGLLELELELELELDELLEVGGGIHGGTTSVVTLLFAGSTSCSTGEAPVACVLLAPPGVMSTVLGGGGAMVGLLELLLLLRLELELVGDPHGSMATVWVKVLLGMTISFDPGGMVLAPEPATTAASEQEVTAIVSGLCCFGITTVRTPGLCSAAPTGS